MKKFGTANAVLTINLKSLSENYTHFQNVVGKNCSVAGIIKANAYGLGQQQIAEKLSTLGCTHFFVATLDEALNFRLYNKKDKIAVLGGLMNNEEKTYITHNITPVLNSLDDVKIWGQVGKSLNQKFPSIIHFDTGVNRLGLSKKETGTLLESADFLDNLDVQWVMSHFACADEKDHSLTPKQAADFANIAQKLPTAQKSLANSSGIFRNKSYHYQMVRPGYSLYGGNPTPETNNPIKPVAALHARILQIRECLKEQSIGYSATHVFDNNTRTATIALGYADGFLRSNSGKSIVYYNNQPCPILGRVSMDLVSIDISDIQGKQPEQGDAIEILGPNQNVDDLAKTAGTIGYEILTGLGSRYKREYI